jgi:hypothetical protein
MTDRDRAEMRALCDQFRREMARQVDEQMCDHEARQRIGQMIGQARQGSEFGYLRAIIQNFQCG